MLGKALRCLGVELICLWLKTLRVQFDSPVPQGVVFGLWHQDLPACMAAFRNRGITVMISTSRDGEWAAMVAQRLGYRVVRGSDSKKSASVRYLAEALLHGGSVGMALDGPRGPALQVKQGAEWLCHKTGANLVRLQVWARPAIRLGSWDQTRVPMPFAAIRVQITE